MAGPTVRGRFPERRGGTCVLVGLPPGAFPTPISDVVLTRLTIRGSIVGTRADLHEALEIAARGAIEVAYETRRLDDIDEVFEGLKAGTVTGRVVLDFRPVTLVPPRPAWARETEYDAAHDAAHDAPPALASV